MARDAARARAVLRLGELAGNNARAAILTAHEDPQGEVRDAAAIALARLGDANASAPFLSAIADTDEAVRASATAGVAANNLAYIYATRGEQLERAQELAQRAKQTMPDRPDVNDTLGWVYYRRNLPALAIPPLEACVARAPDNVFPAAAAGAAQPDLVRPAIAPRRGYAPPAACRAAVSSCAAVNCAFQCASASACACAASVNFS